MKALQINEYGDASKLEVAEVAQPTPKDTQVLLRVKAAGINPFDLKIRSGKMKDMIPMQMPVRLGWEASGIVELVGKDVKNFKAGDEVWAMASQKGTATDAEFAAIEESELALKPKSLSFAEAAALPTTATTAYYFVMELGNIQSGQKILIHGAAGSVGLFAIQFAKFNGAQVIATTSGEGIAATKDAGADEVIDYKEKDFAAEVKNVDVVLDLVGGDFQTKSFAVLKKGGKLLSTVMPPSQDKAKEFGVTAEFKSTPPNPKILDKIAEMIESGKLKIKPPQTFSLSEAKTAHELIENHEAKGKLVFVF